MEKDNHTEPELNSLGAADTPFNAEREQIKELITKEAALNKAVQEKKAYEKKSKQIEKSNTWRYSKPIRAVLQLFNRNNGKQEINELKNKLEAAEKELYATREAMNELMLEDRKLNSYQLLKMMRKQKDKGKIADFIDHTVSMKKSHERNYVEALTYGAKLFINEPDEYRDFIYSKALTGLKIEEIPEFMIRIGLTEDPIPLKTAVSFRGCLNMRMRQKQLVEPLPEWLLDDKRTAYEFMDRIDVRVPWTSTDTFRLEDIPQTENTVIKPTDGAGSRGVYLIYKSDDIIDVKQSKQISSWQSLLENMKSNVLTGWVRNNDWFMEELILEHKEKKIPGRDIKFYCFYGKIGLILEITRFPERKHCWWTADGERVRTGKYDEELFKGDGVTEAELDLAASISLKIPSPFVRIDFLRSEDGLVFGEFTPKPGNYDEFDEITDQRLGDYFAEAQGRLVNDLLNNKQFKEFKGLIK